MTYLDKLIPIIHKNWDKQALVEYSPSKVVECRSYTFAQMYLQVGRVRGLINKLGIASGDHVAFCGTNSAHWMIAYLSVASLRAVSVCLMHSQTPGTLASQIKFADSKLLFVDNEIWACLKTQDLYDNLIVVSLDDWSILRGMTTGLADDDGDLWTIPSVDENAPAQLCFTSSTSGVPKCVVASWKNLTCNMVCVAAHYAAKNNRVMLSVFPLGHTLAIMGEFLVPMYQACTIYIIRETVTPVTLLDTYLALKPFEIVLVPMLVERFLSDKYIDKFRQVLDFVEIGVVCGAKLKKEIEDILLSMGFPLTIPYGLTECSPIVSISCPSRHKPYAAGQVCENMQVSFGKNDEILIKGDHLMLGYYKNDKETNAKLDADGWFHTGDSGYIDAENNLFIRGRIDKDIFVLSSGENVSPIMIESIIDKISGVSESVVVLRNDKLIAKIYSTSQVTDKSALLSMINHSLPMHSQIYDIEFLREPLIRTEKQTIKRYLYN